MKSGISQRVVYALLMFIVLHIPGGSGWLIFFLNSIPSSLEHQMDSLVRNDLITKALVVFKVGAGGIFSISNPNRKTHKLLTFREETGQFFGGKLQGF